MQLGLIATTRLIAMGKEEPEPITIRNANFGELISDGNESVAREQSRQIFLDKLEYRPI